MKKHLFICFTRLQLLISERIIETEFRSDDLVECIYLNSSLGPLNLPDTSNWLKPTSKFKEINLIGGRFFAILKILWNCSGYQCSTVYLASIENFFVHLVLSKIRFNQICTFDDGSGNIDPFSGFYVNHEGSFLKKFVKSVLQVNYDLTKVKSLSNVHYSIFRSPYNVIENIKIINFSPKRPRSVDYQESSTASIFLGTVFSELTVSDPGHALRWCVEHLSGIDHAKFYIPHPRERKVRNLNEFTTVVDLMSAEEAIIDLLNKFEYVVVYGFMNTTQLLFANETRVFCKVFEIAGNGRSAELCKRVRFANEVEIIEMQFRK